MCLLRDVVKGPKRTEASWYGILQFVGDRIGSLFAEDNKTMDEQNLPPTPSDDPGNDPAIPTPDEPTGPTVPEPENPDPYPVTDPLPGEPTPQPVGDPQPGEPTVIPPRIF